MLRYSPIVLAGFFLSVGVAYACSCIQSTPEGKYENADLIFSGVVQNVSQSFGSQQIRYAIAVDDIWKGPVGDTVSLQSHESTATCGIPLQKGKKYLVYANKIDGIITTGLCSGTALYTDSDRDLEYLRSRGPASPPSSGPDCRPYICADGTTHPRCTEDGSPLLYFRYPCSDLGGLPFNDIDPNDPAVPAINYLKEKGIVQGYPDGSFKSGRSINRAEFTKIVVEALFPDEMIAQCGTHYFNDVPRDSWYWKFVCRARDGWLITGYPDRTFRASNEIMFVEAAKILANGYGLIERDEHCNGKLCQDVDTVDHPWYERYVRALEAHGAIPYSIASFEQRIVRSEMAEIIYRLETRDVSQLSRTYEDLVREKECIERTRAGHPCE